MSDLINYEKHRAGQSSGKKRIMRRFRLTEISAVDNPAQKGARKTIMKRAKGTNFGKHERSSPMARRKEAGQFDDHHDYRL